jgi:hypothetical protein
MTDALQRTVLFWDVMRQRSEQYYAQKNKSVPHVLSFDAELVLDGRSFEKPVNYLLVRVKPPAGTTIDPLKRPFVVVDPRAGHGPGIGGFKADSELGVAMRAGHPCYFVGFTPEPMPGQTIEDIVHTEAVFLEKVIALHPDAEGKPCVIGNCQAGWAVLLVAAIRPELFGPIIVPGSPLSYWAGVARRETRCVTPAAWPAGSWMAALASDRGQRQVRRRHAGREFRDLEPVQHLVDQELRSLDQGRYRGASLPRVREMVGRPRQSQCRGDPVDRRPALHRQPTRHRRDRYPRGEPRSICATSARRSSASARRATTSPRRSRPSGWIHDLYGSDDEIRACGQTIIYAVHETVGHLGIFVSGGVARKEHQEFASNIDLIDVLPPGLYEAVMTARRPSRSIRRRSAATGSCASNRARWTTSGPSSSPIPRTSAASPPCDGFRRSIWACIAACCSPSSRRPSISRALDG